jgi:hypothetical protein
VGGEHEFGSAAGHAHGGGGEAGFAARAAGEDEIAFADRHAVQFLRIVEGQEAAVQAAAIGELFHDGGDVAACALHTACSVQLWEEANQHGVSLPRVELEGK